MNITSYDSFSQIFSVTNISSFLLLLVLVFLGVAGRISIDIEISKKSFKDIKFFPRYFLALVLSYVVELYMAEHEDLRKHYAEVIILFCIFVNDIIRFILINTSKILFYTLTAITRVIFDLKNFFVKSEDNGSTNGDKLN